MTNEQLYSHLENTLTLYFAVTLFFIGIMTIIILNELRKKKEGE